MSNVPDGFEYHCLYCGKGENDVKTPVLNPGIFLCQGCEGSLMASFRGTVQTESINSKCVCSFCKKDQDDVETMVAKPGAAICSECVESFCDLLKDPDTGETTEPCRDCSFCSFVQRMPKMFLPYALPKALLGRRLVRGATHCICDDCLSLCDRIIRENKTTVDNF
jgi:hypothetical protein